jgi:hypothetical protein
MMKNTISKRWPNASHLYSPQSPPQKLNFSLDWFPSGFV